MSTSSCGSSDGKQSPPRKKPATDPSKLKQKGLGAFGFNQKVYDSRGNAVASIPVPEGKDLNPKKIPCPGCDIPFTRKGLNGHMATCIEAIEWKAKEARKSTNAAMFAPGGGAAVPGTVVVARHLRQQRRPPHQQQEDLGSNVALPEEGEPGEDKRKYNRGSDMRMSFDAHFKYRHLMHFEQWVKEEEGRNLSSYCFCFHSNEQMKWINSIARWRKSKEKIVAAVSDKIYGNCKRLKSTARTRSPYHQMEQKLYQEIVNHRSRGRKVSMQWIKVKAKKLLVVLDKENGTHRSRVFKASNGWFWRFLRRKNLKFRKRKSGKKKSTDDNLPAILEWYTYLRHNVLPNQPNKPCKDFSEKWGRFPPKLRYNFDQVPLPFVVSQDETFTTADDTDVHVAGHGKGDLRKRQFTMNIYINAGEGEDADGYVELICKGKCLWGKRFSATEKAAWHKNVNMWFQKNAWMDREVMAVSAESFREHIKKRWDPNWKEGDALTSALVICDNLDAHVAAETREVFAADQTVFVCYLPPSVTEAGCSAH